MIGTTMMVKIRPAVNMLAPGGLGGAEDREEAELVVEPGLDMGRDERREDQNAPEAEDDARYRRQHFNQRRQDRARSRRGASRLRKSPIAMPIGVASSSAMAELTAVP